MKTIIVGSGFGGLAAAALLSHHGFDVTVLEKNSQPGGRARVYKKNGYIFDMGPSWYLMPDVFEKFFSEFNKTPDDYYSLTRIDPSYRIFFNDGTMTDVSASLEQNLTLFDSFEPNGGEKFQEYLQRAERHYKLAMTELIYRDYQSIFDMISGKLLIAGLTLPLFQNIDQYISRTFSSDKAKKILEYSIGFIGGSPYNTPALYYIMNHVDFNLGVWYPQGGIGKVVESLQTLASENGAEFKFSTPVTKINIDRGIATSLKTPQGDYPADLIIVNADYPYTELQLLDKPYQSYDAHYWETRVLAPSAIVYYIGLDKKLDPLEHHNLFLEKDWDTSFDSLFQPQQPEWPTHPSYYVNVTSKTDNTVAPDGGETVFILVPLAPGLHDTESLRETFYKQIIHHLEALIDDKIEGHEVVKRSFAMNDFTSDYNAYKGTALGLSHTLRQTALFRPSHQSKKIKNLYYTGHYTHPGIGMPMTLISSQILVHVLNNRYK
jgi:phytoene desaturase